MKKALFCLLIMTSCFYSSVHAQVTQTVVQTQKEKITTSKTLYVADFTQQTLIPKGWRIPGNNAGNVYIENGFLHIDGRSSPTIPTSILLPKDLEKIQNYRIDVEFTLDQALNHSRWGAIIYDVIDSQGFVPAQYFQFTLRKDTLAKNGTEFGGKSRNGQWNVQSSTAYTENIRPNQSYKASIIVEGNHVQQLLNHKVMQDVHVNQAQLSGGIGLSVAGLVMKIKNIRVSELHTDVAVKPSVASEQVIQMSSAPTLVQKMIVHSNQESARSNQAYYQLDANLNILSHSGKAITSLSAYLNRKDRHHIPVFEVKDRQTLASLQQLSSMQNISDITLSSTDQTLLIAAHKTLPNIRTALNLSYEKSLDLKKVIQWTNQSFSKIVILPNTFTDKEKVSYLQRRLLHVWIDSSAVDAKGAAAVLTSGANGVISSNIDIFNQVLAQFPQHTLLRKPFIIGHRGVPSVEDENTLESAQHALKLGADLVENDVHLTKDQVVVVMHDDTVNRTTTGQGKIEEMTLAQVEQLRTKNKNYHVPTLAEYLKLFKKHKSAVLMVEIKSNQPNLINALKGEIEKYDIADQVVLTSFNRDQILRAKTQLPAVGTGILINKLPNQANVVLDETQRFISSYHPPYWKGLLQTFNITQHRGVTYWPWNLNDSTFKQLYLAGLNGVTTNDMQNYSKYIVDIQADRELKVRVDEALNVDLKLKRQDGSTLKSNTHQLIVLDGSAKFEVKNGQTYFKQAGIAHVLAGYRYQMDAQNAYYIFSAPIKVTVK